MSIVAVGLGQDSNIILTDALVGSGSPNPQQHDYRLINKILYDPYTETAFAIVGDGHFMYSISKILSWYEYISNSQDISKIDFNSEKAIKWVLHGARLSYQASLSASVNQSMRDLQETCLHWCGRDFGKKITFKLNQEKNDWQEDSTWESLENYSLFLNYGGYEKTYNNKLNNINHENVHQNTIETVNEFHSPNKNAQGIGLRYDLCNRFCSVLFPHDSSKKIEITHPYRALSDIFYGDAAGQKNWELIDDNKQRWNPF